MNKLLLIDSHKNQTKVKLHNDIIHILFSHKKEISHIFRDIKGLYCLDHIAINIFNPENEVVIFSFTPSIEFNLIMQVVWQYDITFQINNYPDNRIIWWDQDTSEVYPEIRKIKETEHKFISGFNLNKKIDSFKIAYSFATRNKAGNLRDYYQNIQSELMVLGDYYYKSLSHLYRMYCSGHQLPATIPNRVSDHYPHLKLISTNHEK